MEAYKAMVAASGFYDRGFMPDEIASPVKSKFQKVRVGKARPKKLKTHAAKKAGRKRVNVSKRKNR